MRRPKAHARAAELPKSFATGLIIPIHASTHAILQNESVFCSSETFPTGGATTSPARARDQKHNIMLDCDLRAGELRVLETQNHVFLLGHAVHRVFLTSADVIHSFAFLLNQAGELGICS